KITAAMREIYTAPTVAAAEARFAEFAGDWEQTYPAMIQAWRSVWQEFVPFLEFPAELRQGCLHDQRDRVVERALPSRSPSPRPLPQRAVRAQGPLPCRNAAAQEPRRPERQDQRLEDHPQHANRALRRPHRSKLDQLTSMTATATYTKKLTVPIPELNVIVGVWWRPVSDADSGGRRSSAVLLTTCGYGLTRGEAALRL